MDGCGATAVRGAFGFMEFTWFGPPGEGGGLAYGTPLDSVSEPIRVPFERRPGRNRLLRSAGYLGKPLTTARSLLILCLIGWIGLNTATGCPTFRFLGILDLIPQQTPALRPFRLVSFVGLDCIYTLF